MDKDVRDGCAIGCGILIGLAFASWLITIGFIWLICICLGSFGVTFDLGLATAVWLILMMAGIFFGGVK